MGKLIDLPLSPKEQFLLLEVLFKQQYAKEIISCEISDIENGYKDACDSRMKALHSLYIRLDEQGY
ncbi:MAG TPA: antirepressor AbbA [Massilibacterium sp.]|nr:antirepressor AbbA [Massilibacterium sp.]